MVRVARWSGVIIAGCLALAAPAAVVGQSASPSPGTSPAGGTQTVETVLFGPGFSIELPGDWMVFADDVDAFAAGTLDPANPSVPLVGIDITQAEEVSADPCDDQTFTPLTPPIGPSAADLAEWMASLDPLGASEPVPVLIAGREAVSLEESFVEAEGCSALRMWDTGAGYVFEPERKRYSIFEVDGQRIVAVIFGIEETFEQNAGQAQAALETLVFLEDGSASPDPSAAPTG